MSPSFFSSLMIQVNWGRDY